MGNNGVSEDRIEWRMDLSEVGLVTHQTALTLLHTHTPHTRTVDMCTYAIHTYTHCTHVVCTHTHATHTHAHTLEHLLTHSLIAN